MPVWHDRIADLVADGRVVELGVLQEQHPDRADLFMQWKQMEFPLLVDHFNVLEMTAVPVTVFIDEHGIVRDIPRRVRNPRAAVEAFLDATYEAPTTPPVTPTATQPAGEPAAPPATGPPADVVAHAADLRHDARQAILERGDAALDSSIALFERAVSITPDDGRARFSLGVALRMRVDSARARPDDFQRAIDAWGHALALDPNQYIWRRRIQQYGPRLDKPYPFYDWITTARQDIRDRGGTPVAIAVEPGGAEIARPARAFEAVAPSRPSEDPDGRITRADGWIDVTTIRVPTTRKEDSAVRFHVIVRPSHERDVHWNNESVPMRIWLAAPAGWALDQSFIEIPNASTATSTETRRFEIEGASRSR